MYGKINRPFAQSFLLVFILSKKSTFFNVHFLGEGGHEKEYSLYSCENVENVEPSLSTHHQTSLWAVCKQSAYIGWIDTHSHKLVDVFVCEIPHLRMNNIIKKFLNVGCTSVPQMFFPVCGVLGVFIRLPRNFIRIWNEVDPEMCVLQLRNFASWVLTSRQHKVLDEVSGSFSIMVEWRWTTEKQVSICYK